ncbi:flagellar basal body P-ring formation chaperone FlgA [Helicobacter jaachi]|nr:flagellar basal body P-ring formation chaperone FlgA [Helicobacter jaachi]
MRYMFLACMAGILSLCVNIYADDIHITPNKLVLQKTYNVTHDKVYSRDMFPSIEKNFLVTTIPLDRFSVFEKCIDIKSIFLQLGYEMAPCESEMVEFRFISTMDGDMVDFVKKMYVQHYGDKLEISTLSIRPLGTMPTDYTLIDYELSSGLKKNSGTFAMKYRSNNSPQVKKLTFMYEINGTLKVLKSTQNIATNDTISAQNTRVERIKFERVGADYMSESELNKSGAKSYIRADMAITKDKIKPRVVVKKGDRIRVSNFEGGVSMEVVLVARQSGAQNDIINAQNPSSGKILRVKIIDAGKAEMI